LRINFINFIILEWTSLSSSTSPLVFSTRRVYTPQIEEKILDEIATAPPISTRRIVADHNISQSIT